MNLTGDYFCSSVIHKLCYINVMCPRVHSIGDVVGRDYPLDRAIHSNFERDIDTWSE